MLIQSYIIGKRAPRLPMSISKIVFARNVTIQWILLEQFKSTLVETFIVKYGITSYELSYSSSNVTGSDDTDYSIKLDKLLPAKNYFFFIETANIYAEYESEIMTFRTRDSRK